MCVSFDGESLVTASDGDSINLYSCADGGMKRLLHSKKYGCENIKFTHHESQVLYSSSKGSDHAIRYHSLHTNQYIRHFAGNGRQNLRPRDTFLKDIKNEFVAWQSPRPMIIS